MNQGFIQIYTGNGKGKTSAALGIVLRAAGAELKCLIIQFMKEGFDYSEMISIPFLSDWITIERYGNDAHVLEKRIPTKTECNTARNGLKRAREALTGDRYDVIILDEVCVAVHFGLFDADEVTPLFEHKSVKVELILTGRYCPDDWIERADLVTDMREVKHYYSQGILSRKGIDC